MQSWASAMLGEIVAGLDDVDAAVGVIAEMAMAEDDGLVDLRDHCLDRSGL